MDDKLLEELHKDWPYHCYGGGKPTEITVPRVLWHRATMEIERLRAELKIQDDANEILTRSQFRWIPVGERLPMDSDYNEYGLILLHTPIQATFTQYKHSNNMVNVTHWAPIPPLPEKSQADRDDEMLRAWIKSLGAEHTDRENSLRIGYLEGLKAAREQKP